MVVVAVGVTKTQSPPDDDGDEAEEEVGVRRTRVIDGRRRLENGGLMGFCSWEERDGTKVTVRGKKNIELTNCFVIIFKKKLEFHKKQQMKTRGNIKLTTIIIDNCYCYYC